MNKIPLEIQKYVKNLAFKLDNVGCSDDLVFMFENKYILKISSNIDRLMREKEKTDFLFSNHIPGSKSICFICDDEYAYYLRTMINGDSLIADRFLNDHELLISTLTKVYNVLRSLDDIKCPFISNSSVGKDFVHGDFCLPNIFVNSDNEFIGFIDLEDAGLGDKWYDIAWLLWSFEFNLGTNKYTQELLDALNIKFDEEKYRLYIHEENRLKVGRN